MKKSIVMALMLAVAGTAMCQLKSVGSVPADLKMSTQELYESDLQRAEKYTGGKVKEKQRARLREAAYAVGKMMANGRIVYGDPVSRMVNRIADTLLKDYPELRKELRFYTVKSPEVNAFTTGQGMVFVNAGLVAQVEDEAQLAFILSHEIIHYYRNHSMEELVGRHEEGKKVENDDVKGDDKELMEFLLRHHRSHEMENECDSLGIAMFYLRSPYDKNVTEGVFDVLQYSALPFDDVKFDTAFFNTPYYALTGCWLDTVADITSRDNYDDSRSTHPNILKRRRATAVALDGYYGGERYVVTTQEEFEQIRELARKECIRQELIGGEYSRAFYNAWLMRDERSMAQALYSIAMSKIHNGTNSVTGDYRKIEGESQQVYYAMRRMSNEQAALLALHHIWQLHRAHPDDKVYDAMCADLMEALHTNLKMASIDFVTTPPVAESEDTVKQEEKAMTKYERIKQKRQSQTQRKPQAYALTDLLMTDEEFAAELRKHLGGTATAASTDEADTTATALIVYNPSYRVTNERDDALKVKESEAREQALSSMIAKSGRRFKQEVVDFSDAGVHAMADADEYNDFVVLNEWLNEFWQTKGQFDLQRLMQPEMDSLLDRYDASTVCLTAVLNEEGLKPPMTPGYAIIIPLAPVILYNSFSNTELTRMVTVVVDARRGKMLERQSYKYNVADHDPLVEAMLYDTYARIGGKKDPVGYLGRRLALMGGLNFGMAGYQPFSIGKPVVFTPWLSAEYALSRKWTLSAGWSHQNGYEECGSYSYREQYYDYVADQWVVRNVTLTDLSKDMTTWNLTARVYDNSDFAPLGEYLSFGAHWVHFTNPSDGSNGGNSFGLHIGGGRNYIFFDRLVLNIEARYSYTSGLLRFFTSLGESNGSENLYKADAIFANVILLKMGLGILPF